MLQAVGINVDSYFNPFNIHAVSPGHDTFQNNFGIDHQFTKYLKESLGLDFEQYFSFKYFL